MSRIRNKFNIFECDQAAPPCLRLPPPAPPPPCGRHALPRPPHRRRPPAPLSASGGIARPQITLVDGGLDALQHRVYRLLQQPSLQSMHLLGGRYEDPHIYQKIGRQLMAKLTLSGTAHASSDPISSRLNVASLLPDMHSAAAARIA
uniref:Uncharacterized protein n=1 Tax=Corethron hystrix TaxID=216773 RepID=A0A7S1FYT7_9STRA|mmetsp:Transcript_39110/g.91064  ORF Transcript_39110/g.91064 Transcript_39110/m.91064 type:complete len:147 (+) Transcript_39110:494-934(+)